MDCFVILYDILHLFKCFLNRAYYGDISGGCRETGEDSDEWVIIQYVYSTALFKVVVFHCRSGVVLSYWLISSWHKQACSKALLSLSLELERD